MVTVWLCRRSEGLILVREYYGAISRHLLYLTKQPGLAEDLTQERYSA